MGPAAQVGKICVVSPFKKNKKEGGGEEYIYFLYFLVERETEILVISQELSILPYCNGNNVSS